MDASQILAQSRLRIFYYSGKNNGEIFSNKPLPCSYQEVTEVSDLFFLISLTELSNIRSVRLARFILDLGSFSLRYG